MLFFLLFFLIEKGTWFFISETPKREYDKRLEALIKGKINKDIIVIGSSKGAGNILANQLETETGLTSYNLSYQGSNVNFHHFILKTLLKFNKTPKYIVLSIDSPSEFKTDISLNYRKDALLPLTKYNYINTELVQQGINSPMSYLFLLGRYNKYHAVFRDVFVNTNNPIDSFGSMGIIKKKKVALNYNQEIERYNKNFEDKTKLEAFKAIQDICKVNKIDLIFVFSPSFSVFDSSFFKRFEKLKKPENRIFVYDTLKSVYRNPDFFYDESHLLTNGAKFFTSEISEFINH